jgi:predicted acetyltransferase
MAVLTEPVARVRLSFLEAMEEFRAEGRGGPGDYSMVGSETREYGASWRTAEGFERYLRDLREQAAPDVRRPGDLVPCTTLWWVDGAEYLGRIAIRHRLTPYLLDLGGHIGYDVRPSARRRGHATAMLRAALPVARELGIERALITCDADNVASRRVIEKNGGGFEDRRGIKLRFWVPTAPG